MVTRFSFLFSFTSLVLMGCPEPPTENPDSPNVSDAGFVDGTVDGSIEGSTEGSTEGSIETDAGGSDGSSDGSIEMDAGGSDGASDGSASDAGSGCNACPAGTELVEADCSCVDVDECETNNGGCHPEATCKNAEVSGLAPDCVCDVGYYDTIWGCLGYSVCTEEEYESVAATATSDRTCMLLTVCTSEQYESWPATAISDRTCTPLTVCTSEQYESVAPTGTSNRTCTPLSVCTSEQYESVAATAISDRACTPLTVCSSEQYESVAPTATSNRTCMPWSVCTSEQYESAAATATTDRICTALTVCDANAVETQAPTATSDRGCECNAGYEGSGAFCDDMDFDDDGLMDTEDNCVEVFNDQQEDQDEDELGDACDPDIDGDTILNDNDCAPENPDIATLVSEDLDCDTILNDEDCAPENENVTTRVSEDSDCDGFQDGEGTCEVEALTIEEGWPSVDSGWPIENAFDSSGSSYWRSASDVSGHAVRFGLAQTAMIHYIHLNTSQTYFPRSFDVWICDTNSNVFLEADCTLVKSEDYEFYNGVWDAPWTDPYNGNIFFYLPTKGKSVWLRDIQQSASNIRIYDIKIIGKMCDNCPEAFNPEQEDMDNDGLGDVCDEDQDGDGYDNANDLDPTDAEEWTDSDGAPDDVDNCLALDNPTQENIDNDEQGDACDEDMDGDGVGNDIDDDTDGDGIVNSDELYYGMNPSSQDSDGDGLLDQDEFGCEAGTCPAQPINSDDDDQIDAVDTDSDNDNASDGTDNCHLMANEDQSDIDQDDLGDVCDPDADDDGSLKEDDCDDLDDTLFDVASDMDCDGVVYDADNLFFYEHLATSDVDTVFSIFAADLDGDGDMDLLSSAIEGHFTNGDWKVFWLENDGAASPSFTQHLIEEHSAEACDVYAIDLDADGDLDVLSAFDDKIAWYENDGESDPSFTSRVVTYNVNLNSRVHAADVDRDGDMDILSSSSQDDRIAWYENDGEDDPSFALRNITLDADGAQDVYAVDLDGDGDIDVLSAAYNDNEIAWHENDGEQDPSFTSHTITTDAEGVTSLDAIDLDGDGDVDVLAASQTGDRVSWYENHGAGTFTTHDIATEAQGAMSIYAVDFDQDGDVDVLSCSRGDQGISNANLEIVWYENNGDATPTFIPHLILVSNYYSHVSVHAADINGDGQVDALAAHRVYDKILWFEQERDNCPEDENPLQEDMDGDGVGDICDDEMDGDGLTNDQETALSLDPQSTDSDGDGVLDHVEYGCDNTSCPDNPLDTDDDGTIDALDDDSDNDTVVDAQDNCRLVQNEDQNNLDGDDLGDACDWDADGDWVATEEDCDDTNAVLLSLAIDPDCDQYLNTYRNMRSVAGAGWYQACVLQMDGTVLCWGQNAHWQLQVPSNLGTVIDITSGKHHICVLNDLGRVRCWGQSGHLQTNAIENLLTQISAGAEHTCGVRAPAEDTGATNILCVGGNTHAQTDVIDDDTYIMVAAGNHHTCGLLADGGVNCWGENTYGQTTVPDFDEPMVSITAGFRHTCALSESGGILCWGNTMYDLLNDVPTTLDFTEVVAGYNHTCAIKNDRTLICWGSNTGGESAVSDAADFIGVYAGYNYTLGLHPNGLLSMWGDDQSGVLALPESLDVFNRLGPADNCPQAANEDQADADSDGVGDACDPWPTDPCAMVDSDGDSQPNAIAENCDTTLVADEDDDNDGITDAQDACAAGETDWTPDESNDRDNDGCADATEDHDDDNDGILDDDDDCPQGDMAWVASATTDHDSDGCQDSDEDQDDDSDGITDDNDACPEGWLGLGFDDDNDGCKGRTCDENEECLFLDTTTGAIWQTCAPDESGSCTTPHPGCNYDLQSGSLRNCLQTAKDHCNALSWGGHDDWKLPTLNELEDLLRGCSIGDSCVEGGGPGFEGCYWPADFTGSCSRYWASNQSSSGSGGTIDFLTPDIQYIQTQNSYKVRCVRTLVGD